MDDQEYIIRTHSVFDYLYVVHGLIERNTTLLEEIQAAFSLFVTFLID